MRPHLIRACGPHMFLACLSLVLLAVLSRPSQAEEPLSPSAFGDYAEGWTLYFERDGQPWGSESFDPGGAVKWRYPDGNCLAGAWRPHGGQVCFVYEGAGDVLCWRMLRDSQGIFARLLGDGPDAGLELRITGRDRRPLLCGGPGIETRY